MEEVEEDTTINAQVAIICGMCNKTHRVRSYCIDCKDLICAECKISHDSNHITTDRNNKRLMKFLADDISSESVVCPSSCSLCSSTINVLWKCKKCLYTLCETCTIQHMASRRKKNHTITRLKIKQKEHSGQEEKDSEQEEEYQHLLESPPTTDSEQSAAKLRVEPQNEIKENKISSEDSEFQHLLESPPTPDSEQSAAILHVDPQNELKENKISSKDSEFQHLLESPPTPDSEQSAAISYVERQNELEENKISSKDPGEGIKKCIILTFKLVRSEDIFFCYDCGRICPVHCFLHNHANCKKVSLKTLQEKGCQMLEDRRKCLQLMYICQRNTKNFVSFLQTSRIDRDIWKSQFHTNIANTIKDLQDDLLTLDTLINQLSHNESVAEFILLRENVELLALFFIRHSDPPISYPILFERWNFYLHLDEVQAKLIRRQLLKDSKKRRRGDFNQAPEIVEMYRGESEASDFSICQVLMIVFFVLVARWLWE